MKKAITPIIAVILLLMMVIAGAAAAFFWFVKMQSELQSGTEQYQENVYEKISASLSWENAEYNEATEELVFYIQNTGNVKIPANNESQEPTTYWIIKNVDQETVCSTKWDGVSGSPQCISGCGSNTNIQVGETHRFSINLDGSDCDIDAYNTGDMFYVGVYFSGKASAAGTFEK